MQRLEVSGAVRPLKGSLDVKGLKVKNCVSLIWKATVRIVGTKSWSGLSSVTLLTTRRIFTAP